MHVCIKIATELNITNQQVDTLDDIEEDFVLAIFESLRAPRDSVGDSHRGARGHFELVAFLGDELLQDFAVRRLWVAKVHEFIEQLVHNDEIVTNTLLLKLLEVLLEHLDTHTHTQLTCTLQCRDTLETMLTNKLIIKAI